MGRGYWRRPELTAERFIPDPFSVVPGARLYETGDVARYRSDGTLEHLGRLDDQVKIRGFRVELGEIEAALVAHPAVKEAVVSVPEMVPGDRLLVAHVVYQTRQTSTASELRKFLRQHLPDYMVPSLFVELEQLPLTPNGKVDRRTLPRPLRQSSCIRLEYVAPRTPFERDIAAIWQEVLRIDRVSVYDNFFDIGGHSLLAMRAIARIERRLALHVNPRVMIMDTLEQIAARCERLARLKSFGPQTTVAGGANAGFHALREKILGV